MKDVKMVIVVRKDLNMRKGKIAAQVGHAVQGALLGRGWHELSFVNSDKKGTFLRVDLSKKDLQWLMTGTKKIVVSCDSEKELHDLIKRAQQTNVPFEKVIDSGLTEFNGTPTLTCAAFGPEEDEYIDSLTGHLKLL